MRKSAFAFTPLALAPVALAVVTAFAPRPAAAAYNYPWCAQYYDRSAIRSCSFASFEQCRETMNGIGGFCFQNPFGPPPSYGASEPRRTKRRHHDDRPS